MRPSSHSETCVRSMLRDLRGTVILLADHYACGARFPKYARVSQASREKIAHGRDNGEGAGQKAPLQNQTRRPEASICKRTGEVPIARKKTGSSRWFGSSQWTALLLRCYWANAENVRELVFDCSQDYTGRWIQDQPRGLVAAVEVEQAVERAGFYVAGVVADPAEVPIVLDEAEDGGLVGRAVINVILLRVGRDHEQREARAVAAAALCAHSGGSSAIAIASQSIVGDGGLIHNWTQHMVIPAVGVVVGDDNRRVFPVLAVSDGVDHTDVEDLLVNGIGVAGMAILVRGGF